MPEVGEVGSLYFVYGSGGVQSLLYICVGAGLFELYTPDLYKLENKLDSLEVKVEQEADSIEAKIDEIVTAYNNGQEIIDQMVAIQLQTIIGGEE